MDNKPTKLFNKNYLLLWQGQTISRLGSSFFLIPMLLWVKDATGSGAIMGFLFSIASIPGLVLGPFGGAFADRYSRKKIIVFSDVIRGIVVIAVSALLFYEPVSTNFIIGALFVMALINSVILTGFAPAVSASIPELVPTKAVAGANSLAQLSQLISNFLGQGLGGVLYRIIGAPVLFFANGLTFLYAALSDSFVKIPQQMPEKAPEWKEEIKNFWRDVVVGFKYIIRRPGLRNTVVISAVLGFFSAPIMILLPFFVDYNLQKTEDWYGFLVGFFFLGTFIGSIFAGVVRLPPQLRMKTLIIAILIQSIGYALFGFVRNEFFALGLAVVNGVVQGYVTVNILTIVQLSTSGEIRGRVLAILTTISNILVPLATLAAGIALDYIGTNVYLIFLISGIIMTLFVLWVSLNSQFRNFLATDYSAEANNLKQQENYDQQLDNNP